MRARADWTKPLRKPLTIPGVMTLRTLADVRTLISHVPAERRELRTWQHVAAQVATAAWATTDVADAVIALRLVLMLEKVDHK